MTERKGTKALELWCKKMTEGYPGVKVDNMTTSWRDGLAFCAVIHHFRPELIDFSKLNKHDIYSNNELAFTVAEQYLGIPALLDPADMVEYPVPDRLSILTYLSLFHKAFTHGSSPSKAVPKRPATATERGIVSPASTSPPTKMAVRSGVNVGLARREPCAKCGLPVFIAERLNVGKQLYHRTCFRCARCNSQLTLQNYYEIETENQYCCETCPDEETSTKMVAPETARLTRSLSDEEKSAGLRDDYSCMFETALEYNTTDDSGSAKARTQFMSALLDSSGEEDRPPDLPKTQKPALNISQDFSPIVKEDTQPPTSERIGIKSSEPSVNNRSFSDVHINQQKTASRAKLDENTDVLTKENVQGSTSLVQARMRLFQPAVPSPRRSIKPEVRREETNKHTVLKDDSVLSDNKKRTDNDGNSEVITTPDVSPLRNNEIITIPEISLLQKNETITISDDSLLQRDEVIVISDDSLLQKDEVISISEDSLPTKDDDSTEQREVNRIVSNTDDDSLLQDCRFKTCLDDSRPENSDVFTCLDDSHLQENAIEEREAISTENRESETISTPEDPQLASNTAADCIVKTDEMVCERVESCDIEESKPIADTSVEDSNKMDTREKVEDSPKVDASEQVEDSRNSVVDPQNVEASEIVEKQEAQTLDIERDHSKMPTDESNLEPNDEQVRYPVDLNPFGDEEETSKYEKSLNPFGDDEDDDEPVEMKKITPNARDYQLKGSSGDTPENLLRTNVKRISTNPFDDDEDEEVVKPAPRLKRLTAPKISLNPIFPDQLGLSPNAAPEPRPRTSVNSGISTGTFGSCSSISSGTSSVASRKKKAAPRPPIPTFQVSPDHSVNTSPSGSVQHSPRLRKNRRAPLPPTSTPCMDRDVASKIDYSPIPPINNSTLKPCPDRTGTMQTETWNTSVLSPTDSIESGEYEKEKVAKDEVNRNRQSQTSQSQSPDKLLHTSSKDKSTYGKWKRKKGQAPSRPIPQKRTIKALPMGEVRRELDLIEVQQQGLEKQGVRLEQIIRERCEGPDADPEAAVSIEAEDLILQLFEVVNEKNELCRRQAELMYLQRQQRLEEEYVEIEYQIRCLMLQPDANKTDTDKQREESLIGRLVEVVERRNEIIECLEMDRVREAEEDDSICSSMNSYASKRDECSTPESTGSPKKKDKKRFKKKFKLKMSSHKRDMDKDVDESESADSSIVVKEKKKKKFNLF